MGSEKLKPTNSSDHEEDSGSVLEEVTLEKQSFLLVRWLIVVTTHQVDMETGVFQI